MTERGNERGGGPAGTERAQGPILVIEDDPNQALIMRKRLERKGFEVISAADGEEGLELCLQREPDIVLSDWMMPRRDGVSVCREIRKTPQIEHTYVILISNNADAGERVRGLDAGADDYLEKTCDLEELYARIRAGFRIRGLQRELQRQTRIDPMTRLFNRGFFFERVDAELRRLARYQQPLTVAMIDLDDFKIINDTRGHLAGDAAIRHAAKSIQIGCRDSDVVSRYGGDEFAVLFVSADESHARAVMDRISTEIDLNPFRWEGESLRYGLSYGIAVADLESPPAPDDFINQAD